MINAWWLLLMLPAVGLGMAMEALVDRDYIKDVLSLQRKQLKAIKRIECQLRKSRPSAH